MSECYLNGHFVKPEQALVSVMDRGFLFGDGVYEVIPVYNNKLFRLQSHLDRLQKSLDGILLDNPMNQQQWQAMLQTLLDKNPDGEKSIYLQVTRGYCEKRHHSFPEHPEPTVFARCMPLNRWSLEKLQQGIDVITLKDTRWQHCHIKTTTLLPNVLLNQQAKQQGAAEAILIRDGLAIECSSSNLFIVKQNTIITPPLSALLLGGITRDLVIELTKQHQLALQERDIAEDELAQADEIWITSSTREIAPVVTLNGNMVGEGKPGPLWQQVMSYYQDYKKTL